MAIASMKDITKQSKTIIRHLYSMRSDLKKKEPSTMSYKGSNE